MRVASRWRNARSWVTNTTAPAIVGEEVLEPGDRVDVEVVGRLVEQQHVGLGRPARAPAARAAASRPTACRRRASAGSSSRDRIRSTWCSRRQSSASCPLDAVSPSATTSKTDRVRGERHVLHEPRDAQRRLPPDRAGVGRHFAADDLQQRRLAGAVAADDRHALARRRSAATRVEQRQMAEGDGYGVERSDDRITEPRGSQKSDS